MCECGVCNECHDWNFYGANMKQINVGDNAYDVDLEDHQSIITALRAEIMFQHGKHNITVPARYGNGQEYEPNIYIRNRSSGAVQIQYNPTWSIYNDYRGIIGFSKNTEKTMNDIITKVIAKCIKRNEKERNQEQSKIDFEKYVKDTFPYIDNVKIECSEYGGSHPNAIFEARGVKATLHKDKWLTINVEKDNDIISDVINKLFR